MSTGWSSQAKQFRRQRSINDWLAEKSSREHEEARQEKSSKWGSWGRLAGAVGGGLLGLALAPFTAGTSLAWLATAAGTKAAAAIGAGLGSGIGTAAGQQWAGGMHGQRTEMEQSINPMTGEAVDIRDKSRERQFEKEMASFSDQQRDLRTTRMLTDAMMAYQLAGMGKGFSSSKSGIETIGGGSSDLSLKALPSQGTALGQRALAMPSTPGALGGGRSAIGAGSLSPNVAPSLAKITPSTFSPGPYAPPAALHDFMGGTTGFEENFISMLQPQAAPSNLPNYRAPWDTQTTGWLPGGRHRTSKQLTTKSW